MVLVVAQLIQLAVVGLVISPVPVRLAAEDSSPSGNGLENGSWLPSRSEKALANLVNWSIDEEVSSLEHGE